MTEILFDNNASALLAVGAIPADLTITVDAGDGALFPSPGANEYAVCAIEDDAGQLEYVHLTSRAADVLTVTRAREGTVAGTFAIGARIELRLTKGTLEWLVQKDAVVNQIRGASVADLPITWAANQPQINGDDIATISDIPVTTAYTDTFLASASAGVARVALGASAVGDAVFIAATTAAGRTALGAGATGSLSFLAATASDGRGTIKVGDQRMFWATAVAGTNALTCTIDESTALQVGDMIILVPVADNTGSMTLNPSGIGVIAIKDVVSGENLAAGSMLTGEICALVYNGSVLEYSDGIVMIGEETFTASGNLTKPAWADDNTFCFAELVGGGGSGGKVSLANDPAGGGAGGSYIRAIIPAAEVPASAAVTIGAGAAARTSAGAEGLWGGDTTLALTGGGTVFAGGGFGGLVNADSRFSTHVDGSGQGETTPSYYVNPNAFEENGGTSGDGSSAVQQGDHAPDTVYSGGGGGGGAVDSSPGPTDAGTSVYAGDGGAGGYGSTPGTDGNVPGGGGGGGGNGGGIPSGAGADGKAVIKWIRIGRRSTIADGNYLMRRVAI